MSFSKTRVAVLRGGPSSGYDDSLSTGGHILSSLRAMPLEYEPIDIFISREGEWHRDGLVENPHHVLSDADVVWNALHGPYGEDIQVQRVMEGLRIPFVGSSSVASALAVNKDMAKDIYRRNGLNSPMHEVIAKDDLSEDNLIIIFRNYLHPVRVRPVTGYGSSGVSLAYTFVELKEAVESALNHFPRVLVEEYIEGYELSCPVMEEAREERLYALIPAGHSKSEFGREENEEIGRIAKLAHEALGLSHYSSSDFIITPRKKIYIVETHPQPVFHQDSLMHKSLLSTGWRPEDFVDHILKLVV